MNKKPTPRLALAVLALHAGAFVQVVPAFAQVAPVARNSSTAASASSATTVTRTASPQAAQPDAGRPDRAVFAGQAQPSAGQAGNSRSNGGSDPVRDAFRASGGSLYRMEHGDTPVAGGRDDIFSFAKPDPKRIRKNDLITVIVREESNSASKSSTDTKKSADMNSILQQYFEISNFALKGKAPLANQPSLQYSLDRNFKGEGTVDRSDSMSARVQATVVDVRPNGVLILEATKQIKMDDEELKFILTGQVRAEDVTIDNSVLSTQLADLQLEKTTKGAARDASKRGWIPKLMDAINPF